MNYSNETILVSNSPIVLEKEFGSVIDSFDTVVRFNNYVIEGYEKYVGTKTDVWSTRICGSIHARSKEEKSEYSEIIAIHNHCLFNKAIQQLLPQFLTKNPRATIVQNETSKKYSKLFEYDPKKNWLTVGMITILYMLDIGYDRLHLYGFSGDVRKHYFPKNPKDPGFHNFKKEAEHIKMLEDQGKVVIL